MVSQEVNGVEYTTQHFQYVMDKNDIIRYISSSSIKILGRDDLVGKHYFEIVSDNYKDLILRTKSYFVTNSKETEEFEVSLITADGSKIFHILRRNIFFNNNFVGVEGIAINSEEYNELHQSYCETLLYKSHLSICLRECLESNKKEVYDKANQITVLFEQELQFKNKLEDMWDKIGREKFLNQAAFFIERKQTLQFVLPAFPFKSQNRNKCLDSIPDLGEELALTVIHKFCEEVDNIYEFGLIFNIVSDGRVFADICKIDDDKVDEYDNGIRKNFPHLTKYIRFYDLNEFLETGNKHFEARDKLLKLFGNTVNSIEEKIKLDPDYTKMYLGFLQFNIDDIFFIKDGDKYIFSTEEASKLSITQCKKKAKENSKAILRRNDAYSKMIEKLFPFYIRLSIHAHNNSGPKFAIRMLPLDKISEELVSDSTMHIPTPWHNVVVQDLDGKYFLKKKWIIEKMDAELIYKNGQPYFYKLK